MWKSQFSGEWTYRSLKNDPALADDFNKVKFGEGVLTLREYAPGLLSGSFDFGGGYRLTVLGSVTGDRIRLRSTGEPNTPTAGWIYEHEGRLVPGWLHGDQQRPAIVGSVLRTISHDGRPAGLVGSFVAVSSSAVVGKGIEPLPEAVAKELGKTAMRLHHTVWHATRNSWNALNDATQHAIHELGWAPPRPSLEFIQSGPRRARKRANTRNGAGEDFLFMHREMIMVFRKAMADAGVADWQPWISIPAPGSGPTVPPAWDNGDETDSRRFAALKTDEFYWSRMRWWDEQFKDPVYLRTLTLGELGAQLEWSVHNDMHMRWSGIARDPLTNDPVPEGRAMADFDPKWDLPTNDDLADFYASHVNPIFYKLHGWIDDRIDDWFDAHEAHEKGSVERVLIGTVPWFKPGKWVQVERPWSAPPGHDHGGGHSGGGHGGGHGHGDAAEQPPGGGAPNPMDDETLRKVIRLIDKPIGEAKLLGVGEARRAPNWARVGVL